MTRAGGRLRRWRKRGAAKHHPKRRNWIFDADTVPVVSISALPIVLFLLTLLAYGVWAVVWQFISGNTRNNDYRAPRVEWFSWIDPFLYVVEPCLFLIGAVAISVSLVRGVRARRLTAGEVSQDRFVCSILVIGSVGIAGTGRSPLWFTAVGCVVCLAVMFAVRTKHRTRAVDPLFRRPAGLAQDASMPVYPGQVEVAGQVLPVAWHVPDARSVRDGDGGDTAAAWAVFGDADGVHGQLPVGARIEYDASFWYKPPCRMEQVDAWLQATLADLNRRYGLADESAEAHVLLRMLRRFVTADMGSPNRLIHFGDEPPGSPLPVVCPITVDLTGGRQGASALPAVETPAGGTTVEAGTGLIRYDSYSSGNDGARLMAVRYHRRIPELRTDIVLTCEGIPGRDVPTMLPRLDALACSIAVTGQDGQTQ